MHRCGRISIPPSCRNGHLCPEEYWGCGLGSYLIQLAIDQTRSNGFEQLELGVYSDNSRAIHLYEKVGFESYGIQPRALS